MGALGDQHFGKPDVTRHAVAGADTAGGQKTSIAGEVEQDKAVLAHLASYRESGIIR